MYGEMLKTSGVGDFGLFVDRGATMMAMGTGVGHSGSKMGLADLSGVCC